MYLRVTAAVLMAAAPTLLGQMAGGGCTRTVPAAVAGGGSIAGAVITRPKSAGIESEALQNGARTVLLLDVSSSTAQSRGAWRGEFAEAAHLLQILPESDAVAAALFAQRLAVFRRANASRSALAAWLASAAAAPPEGPAPTALYDSLNTLAVALKPGDIIVTFTDASDDMSTLTLEQTVRNLLERGVRVVIALPAGCSDCDQADASKLAMQTGGAVVALPARPGAGQDALEAVINDLTSGYLMRIKLPPGKGHLEPLNITLPEVAGARAPKLMFPRAIAACEHDTRTR